MRKRVHHITAVRLSDNKSVKYRGYDYSGKTRGASFKDATTGATVLLNYSQWSVRELASGTFVIDPHAL